MNKEKSLLIINRIQFGYHTDSYKYCEYLIQDYNIDYLCFYSGFDKLIIDGVKVRYVSDRGGKILRGIRFFVISFFYSFIFNGLIFIVYFKNCHLIKRILYWKSFILDIRTMSINSEKAIRERYDDELSRSCNYFDFITVISEGLRNKLRINDMKSTILPLGSDIISNRDKNFFDFKLLYVGTLNNRNIIQTVKGLDIIIKNQPELKGITYDIIGDGSELNEIRSLIDNLGLRNNIKVHGRIPHFRLQNYFDECNIGISHVPITDYYEFQPVTKTYEYILSGMVCMATDTFENRKLINDDNGVLYQDNPTSFADAFNKVLSNKVNYNSHVIRQTLKDYTWRNIVKSRLYPILSQLYSRVN
jgi:glycosyltransferase involved in cell wall biosynthesis